MNVRALVYCFVFIYVQFHVSLCQGKNVTGYLDDQLKFVTSVLKKPNIIHGSGINLEFYNTQPLFLRKEYKTAPFTFTLFGTNYLLVGADIYALTEIYKAQPLRTLKLPANVSVTSLEATEHNNFAVISLALSNGVLQIYQKPKTGIITFAHSLAAESCSAVHFFAHDDDLYLVVANVADRPSACDGTCVFRWNGAHFDKIDEVRTSKTGAISSFPGETGRIVVVPQRRSKTQVSSFVFVFKQEKLRKVQILKTHDPTHSWAYNLEGRYYVTVLDSPYSSVYLWADTELIPISFFPALNADVVYLRRNAIIATKKEHVEIYKPTAGAPSNVSMDLRMNFTDISAIIPVGEEALLIVEPQALLFLPFTLTVAEPAAQRDENESGQLFVCMKKLGRLLENKENEAENLERKREKLEKRNEASPAKLETVRSAVLNLNEDKLNNLKGYLQRMEGAISALQPKLQQLETAFKNGLTLHGDTMIKGNLLADAITVDSLRVEKINDLKWNPESWLSYDAPQRIRGPVFMKNVIVKNLETPVSTFKDLLLRTGNQVISGRCSINSLSCSNVHGKTINGINFNDIYLKSRPLQIKGVKTFDALTVRNVTTNLFNKKLPYEMLNAFSEPNLYHFKFGSHLNVENLNVGEINGVNFDAFKNSAFRIGKSRTILGNLKLAKLNANKLTVKTIDNIDAGDFLTTNTDQNVSSTIHFRNIHVRNNTDCGNVNGANVFKEAANFANPNNSVVHGPVSVRNMKVYERLYIDSSKANINSSDVPKEEDVLQVYHKKVRITGNVVVDGVFLENQTKVMVGNRSFQVSDVKNYWLKNEFQVIPVHVTFQHGASVPHLVTTKINNVDIKKFMVQNVDNVTPGSFHFQDLTVSGDVFLNQNLRHLPDLRNLDRTSVKYSGSYSLKGRKVFEGTVTIKNLDVGVLNDVESKRALTKNTKTVIGGRKEFENVVVLDNLEGKNGVVNSINRVNLRVLQRDALYVDQDVELSNVTFGDLRADNIWVSKLNGKTVEVGKKEENLLEVRLQGNVTVNNAKVKFINGIPVSKLLNNTVVLDREVYSPGTVETENLNVVKINGVNLKKLSPRLLYRNYDQEILAPFTFNTVHANNLVAEQINNISLADGTRPSNTHKNLKLDNVKYIKTLKAQHFSCDVSKALRILETPRSAKWRSVLITGDLSLDEDSELPQILRNVVTSNAINTISAPVTFLGLVTADAVSTSGTIGGFNVTEISRDAVYIGRQETVVVKGRNTFHSLKAGGVTVHGNAAIPVVNGVSVAKINSSVIPKSAKKEHVVKGRKSFCGGLQAKRFHVESLSGVKPEDLVSLANVKRIPKVVFDRLAVSGNMTVVKVNDDDFDLFLRNRVLCKTDQLQILRGNYYFEEMSFLSAVSTPHINNLLVEEIVTDDGIQNINIEKIFANDVLTQGAITIDRINDTDIQMHLQDAIMDNRNESINGNMEFSASCEIRSRISANSLNGLPIDRLNHILRFHDPEIISTSAQTTLEKIVQIVEKSSKRIESLSDEFMYIEEVASIPASIAPSLSSRVITLSDNSSVVLLDGQVPGTSCGLPVGCSCPVEYSVYIDPAEVSVHNNGLKRIFKNNNEELSVSLSTNSVSVSPLCRTNTSKNFYEDSLLSWKNTKLNVVGSSRISGYLSDAEFFNSNGRLYVVFCEYYDPVSDTYELFCTVARSTEKNDAVEEIQKIPAKGAWKLHIVYTAQGIILIVGNVVPGVSNYTEIYRFKPQNEMFVFLRSVKTMGCTAAEGVVLGAESLIVLAQPKTPLQILKYEGSFDNYYHYDSLSLESSVASVSVFYIRGFGVSDAFLCVVMENGAFNLYSFTHIEGWKLVFSAGLLGLEDLIPIELDKQYLFAPTTNFGRLLAIIKQSYV